MVLARRLSAIAAQRTMCSSMIALTALSLAGCASMSAQHYADPFPAPMSSGRTVVAPKPARFAMAPRQHRVRRTVPRQSQPLRVDPPVAQAVKTPAQSQPAVPSHAPTPGQVVSTAQPREIAEHAPAPVTLPTRAAEPAKIRDDETAQRDTGPFQIPVETAPELPVPHPGGDTEARMAALAPERPAPPETQPTPLPPPAQGTEPQTEPPAPTVKEVPPSDPATASAPGADPKPEPQPEVINRAEPTAPREPVVAAVPVEPSQRTVSSTGLPRQPEIQPAPGAAERETTEPPAAEVATPNEPTTQPAAPARQITVTPQPKSQDERSRTPAQKPVETARAAPPAPTQPRETQPQALESTTSNAPAPLVLDVRCPELPNGGPDADCQSGLTPLLLDRSNGWVMRPPTAADYVAGSRLVAFAQLRNRLTCRQLRTGVEEAQTAVIALRAAIDGEATVGRPTARLERTRELAIEARAKLESANTRRC